MDATKMHAFAENMVTLGRRNGYTHGLARAQELMREHGIEFGHPARTAVFNAMMKDEPPPLSGLATPDAA
jgi:hypothetical protein